MWTRNTYLYNTKIKTIDDLTKHIKKQMIYVVKDEAATIYQGTNFI